MRSTAIIALLVLAGGLPAVAATAYQPIATAEPATAYALTEDGAHLLVAHELAGAVSVCDMRTGGVVRTLRCPSPKAILARGGKAYVLAGTGTAVTVVDTAQWTIADELRLDVPNAFQLSAAQGQHFDGRIVVTGGSTNEGRIVVLDSRNDRSTHARSEAYIGAATVTYNGAKVLVQGMFSHSPSGTVRTYPFAQLATGPGTQGEHADTPRLGQCRPGSFWVGGGRVLVGDPPRVIEVGASTRATQAPDPRYLVTAMDARADRLYVVSEARTEAFGMDVRLPAAGAAASSVPAGREADVWAVRRWIEAQPGLAATLDDGATRLVVPGRDPGVLLWASMTFEAVGATAGAAADATAPAPGTFPARATVGRAIAHRLVPEGTKGSFSLMSGPKGMTVDAGGLVSWTPSAEQEGPQSAKIRAEVAGEVRFHRLACEVVAAGADPAAAAVADARHPLLNATFDLVEGADGTTLLLQDDQLRIIDRSGLGARDVRLPAAYRWIRERPRHWVGVADDRLDIVDKKTLAVTRSTPLGGRKANAMACHPRQPLTYVSVDLGARQHDAESMRIVVVDEGTGQLSKPDQLYGNMIAFHPSGTVMYTAIKDLLTSEITVIGISGDLGTFSSYRSVDLLLEYGMSGRGGRMRTMHPTPGANGSAVVVSPDGAWVSYVSGGGYRTGEGKARKGYVVPAFSAKDITKAECSYETGAYPRGFAYHPTLPLVAATDGNVPMVYDQRTCERSADRLDLAGTDIRGVERLLFAGDGMHLLAAVKESDGRRWVLPLTVRLDATERAATRAPRPEVAAPAGAEPARAARRVALADLDALKAGAPAEMTAAQLAKRYEAAVVVIEGGRSSATGFFVGRSGYILTCAHGLPMPGEASVRYRAKEGDTLVTLKDDKPEILLRDAELDLALIKIASARPVQTVALLGAGAKPAMGDRVYIIGNPGGGGRILESTMTEGLVSNPAREMDGQVYIQTSAAVNPGSSGSPLFTSTGLVGGLVVMKAMDAEAAGFAVPAARLTAFLQRAAKGD